MTLGLVCPKPRLDNIFGARMSMLTPANLSSKVDSFLTEKQEQVECTFIDLEEYCECSERSIVSILFKWSIAGSLFLLSLISLFYLSYYVCSRIIRRIIGAKRKGPEYLNQANELDLKYVQGTLTRGAEVTFQDNSRRDTCDTVIRDGSRNFDQISLRITTDVNRPGLEIRLNATPLLTAKDVCVCAAFVDESSKNCCVEVKVHPSITYGKATSYTIAAKTAQNFRNSDYFITVEPIVLPTKDKEFALWKLHFEEVWVKFEHRNAKFQNSETKVRLLLCEQFENCQKDCNLKFLDTEILRVPEDKRAAFKSDSQKSTDVTQRESFYLMINFADMNKNNREDIAEIVLQPLHQDTLQKDDQIFGQAVGKANFIDGKANSADEKHHIIIQSDANQIGSDQNQLTQQMLEKMGSSDADLSELDADNTTAPEIETVFEAEMEEEHLGTEEFLSDTEVEVEATIFLAQKFDDEQGDTKSQCQVHVLKSDENRVSSPVISIAHVLSLLKAGLYDQLPSELDTLDAVAAIMREAGLESSNLIFGIDYTASNKYQGDQCFGGKSLHYIEDGVLNPYQQVITIFGKSLAPFAKSDTYLTAFGFGDAATTDESVFHLKPGVFCSSFEEILDLYNEVTPQIILGGPTNFAPLIYEAIHLCKKARQYHILAIVADGQVTNERATRRAIVDACRYPLSIIVVGVGDGPWDMMRVFDDSLPKRPWDNFHFIEFGKIAHQSNNFESAFAAQSLLEIPEQYKTIKRLGLLDFNESSSSDSADGQRVVRRSSRNRKNYPQLT